MIQQNLEISVQRKHLNTISKNTTSLKVLSFFPLQAIFSFKIENVEFLNLVSLVFMMVSTNLRLCVFAFP